MCQGQMCLFSLGELCAATSDLANQTGIEKTSFDHPQAELDILSF